MRAPVALILVLLSGCYGVPPDEVAWRSPRFHVGVLVGERQDFFTPEVLDVSTEHIVSGLAALGVNHAGMLRAAEGAFVDVRVGPFQCIGYPEGVLCDGQQSDERLIVATQLKGGTDMCVWQTAFMHELTHLFIDDSEHSWTAAWTLSGDQLGECK